MKIEEAFELIKKEQYNFTKKDIKFDISELCEGTVTLAMYWIYKWKTLPPKVLIHDPAIQDGNGFTCAML